MQIAVKFAVGTGCDGKEVGLEVEDETTTDDIKAMIRDTEGIAPEQQRLLFNGRTLVRGQTVAQYNIARGDALMLVVRPKLRLLPAMRALDDAMQSVERTRHGMRVRWEQLYEEKIALSAQKADLIKQHGGDQVKDRNVRFNIGGQTITIKSRKLISARVPGSGLDAFCSGRWYSRQHAVRTASIEKGRPVIVSECFADCDPECFRRMVELVQNADLPAGQVLVGPLETPQVADSQGVTVQPMMERTLAYFGLGYLFERSGLGGAAAAALHVDEGVPPAEGDRAGAQAAMNEQMDPEPEGSPPRASTIEEVDATFDEYGKVDLPPLTIDHIVEARYGVLTEANKTADVTAGVAEMVGTEGELAFEVINKVLGVDPAQGVVKQLSLRYRRCDAWERTPIPATTGSLQAALAAERTELRAEIKAHQAHVRAFAQEQRWIRPFLRARQPPEAAEVVELDIQGVRCCTLRTTLTHYPGSEMAKRFGLGGQWAQGVQQGGDAGSSSDDGEGGEDDVVICIHENAYCFQKVVNQLRMLTMAQPDDTIPPLVVAQAQRAACSALVQTLYPGVEEFLVAEQRLPPSLVYGTAIKLQHVKTGARLHSHALKYPAGSKQQQVTCFSGADDNDWWRVKAEHGAAQLFGAVPDGAIIRLEHVKTNCNLHSHDVRAHVTQQTEVSCCGKNGNGDTNCNWRVIYGQDASGALRLQHVNMGAKGNHFLHSHEAMLPSWGHEQQEVTLCAGKDDNDLWRIQEVRQ